MFRKIVNVAVLTADLLPGALLVAAGLGLVVANMTGTLWY